MKFAKAMKLNTMELHTRHITRAFPFIVLHPQSTWVIGPAFLYEQTLPDRQLEQEVEVINVLGKIDKQTNLLTFNVSFQSCIKFGYYSSFDKLLKYIAWILKFKKITFRLLQTRTSRHFVQKT